MKCMRQNAVFTMKYKTNIQRSYVLKYGGYEGRLKQCAGRTASVVTLLSMGGQDSSMESLCTMGGKCSKECKANTYRKQICTFTSVSIGYRINNQKNKTVSWVCLVPCQV